MTPRFFSLRGFMKSGTNWLGNLLSSHHDIRVVGEFHWHVIKSKFEQQFGSLPVYLDSEPSGKLNESVTRRFEQLVRETLAEAAPGVSVIGDRTPHTISPIVLRDAPVISIVRDGRDVLVSRAFHLHNYPEVHRLFQRIPEMMEDHLAFKENPWYFKKHPERLLRHEVMVRESVRWWMEHILSDRTTESNLPDLRICKVKYEELHQNTLQERQRLFEFLQVAPQAADDISGFLKPGFAKEQPTEFYRKGVVGDWKNYFSDETKRWFNEEAGEELIRLGYEHSTNW